MNIDGLELVLAVLAVVVVDEDVEDVLPEFVRLDKLTGV
jgi:hypothetical protein